MPTPATSRVLQLCLLGLASTPGTADAGDRLIRRDQPPRCTPIAPSSGLNLGALSPTTVDMDGPVADLSLSRSGQHWAVGSSGQIRHRSYPAAPWTTIDSGTTADLSAIATSADTPLPWIVGAQGTVLRYGPSGLEAIDVPTDADLLDVVFRDGSGQGAIAGKDGTFLLTVDGGATWFSPGRMRSKHAITQLILGPMYPLAPVLALRDDGVVLIALPETSDAETRWSLEEHTIPGAALPLQDLFAKSMQELLVVDSAGTLWSTSDGGSTWQPSLPPTGRHEQAPDPIRAIETTPIGIVAVRQSGHLLGVSFASGTAQLTPPVLPANTTALPEPPAGLVLTRAISSEYSGALIALTADGQVMEQMIQPWFEPGHPCGRPFEIDRKSRCASAVQRTGWASPLTADLPDMPEAVRKRLAAAWLRDARAEHASVASFARFSLRLMALGAPADLLTEAQQAMGDEIRHARHCFALASHYAQTALAPGPLPIDGALDGPTNLHAVAVEVLREGAIGETIGAVQAAEMRDRATDPTVRAALNEIADDEARHAQMAWRFLRWAIEQGGPSLRDHLRAALPEALASWQQPRPEVTALADPALWAAHGRLSPLEEHRSLRRSLRQVIHPLLAQLLPPESDIAA